MQSNLTQAIQQFKFQYWTSPNIQKSQEFAYTIGIDLKALQFTDSHQTVCVSESQILNIDFNEIITRQSQLRKFLRKSVKKPDLVYLVAIDYKFAFRQSSNRVNLREIDAMIRKRGAVPRFYYSSPLLSSPERRYVLGFITKKRPFAVINFDPPYSGKTTLALDLAGNAHEVWILDELLFDIGSKLRFPHVEEFEEFRRHFTENLGDTNVALEILAQNCQTLPFLKKLFSLLSRQANVILETSIGGEAVRMEIIKVLSDLGFRCFVLTKTRD